MHGIDVIFLKVANKKTIFTLGNERVYFLFSIILIFLPGFKMMGLSKRNSRKLMIIAQLEQRCSYDYSLGSLKLI